MTTDMTDSVSVTEFSTHHGYGVPHPLFSPDDALLFCDAAPLLAVHLPGRPLRRRVLPR